MTELHNDGQDREQREVMRGSPYLRPDAPEDAVMKRLTVFHKLLQAERDRAYRQGRGEIFDAIDNLIAGISDLECDYGVAVAEAHRIEGSDFTVSGIAREQAAAGWRQR